MKSQGDVKTDQGFALLIVLWTLILISFVLSVLIASADQQVRVADMALRAAQMQARADGAIWEGIFHASVSGPERWSYGKDYSRQLQGMSENITITSEAGLINPNTASRALLEEVLRLCGARSEQAHTLAEEIVIWRGGNRSIPPDEIKRHYLAAGLDYAPPQEPFHSVDELGLIVNMPPVLLKAIAPHLSVTQMDDPDFAQADPLVKSALKTTAPRQIVHPEIHGSDKSRTVIIDVSLQSKQGFRTYRHATVLIEPAGQQ